MSDSRDGVTVRRRGQVPKTRRAARGASILRISTASVLTLGLGCALAGCAEDPLANDLEADAGDPMSDAGDGVGDDGGSGEGGTGGEDGGDEDEDCTDSASYFAERVWPEVGGPLCQACHMPGGAAALHDPPARLILPLAGDSNVLEGAFTAFSELADEDAGELPILVAKPSNGVPHGGGPVAPPESDAHSILSEWVELERSGFACDEAEPAAIPTLVLEPKEVSLRRATVQLLGRLPTAQELEEVNLGADLRAVVLHALDEPGFKPWVQEIFNDRLHAQAAYFQTTATKTAQRLFKHGDQFEASYEQAVIGEVSKGAGRSAVELIWHVVSQDQPLTEILVADYMMANPPLAIAVNAEEVSAFPDLEDQDDWRPVRARPVDAEGVVVAYPHSGVLTDLGFLAKWVNNPSNQSRRRAWIIYRAFLGVDILSLSQQVPDPSSTEVETPTVNDPSCSVCHQVMDPVAAIYGRYSRGNSSQASYGNKSTDVWPEELHPPGFAGATPPDDLSDIEVFNWLGEQIGADPRFARTMVVMVYEDLLGRNVLPLPEGSAESAEAAMAAYNSEQSILDELTDAFVTGGFNFKVLVAHVVASRPYRVATLEGPGAELPEWQNAFGSGRLVRPEHLGRRLNATLDPQSNEFESLDSRLLFGGIDSHQVTERIYELSSVSASVVERMAYNESCRAAAADFHLPAGQRVLFPHTSLEEGIPSQDDAVGAQTVRYSIAHLYWQILGVRTEPSGAEVAGAYELLLAVKAAGAASVEAGTTPATVEDYCLAAPEESADPHYTLRAWAQLVRYLMLDERFTTR